MIRLTNRQTEVLDFIKQHFDDFSYGPTRKEIAKGIGFSSPHAAEEHLKALARKGAIELIPAIARGIRIPQSKGIPIVSIDDWLPEKKRRRSTP